MSECPFHPDRLPLREVYGRVLVCDECANDEELMRHARSDWR